MNFKIDLVYLWCDGNDPELLNKRNSYLCHLGQALPDDNVGEQRYIEHNELLYSLRSAFVNLPWINHIYIVTDNQRPRWLNDSDLITIVDHKTIIPANLLPTFNSIVIETYIDKIPGLSEHFIYTNDDVFFMSKLNPEDFFDQRGIPIVRFSKTQSRAKYEWVLNELKSEPKVFFSTLQKAWLLFCRKYKKQIDFDTIAHSADSYTISAWRSALNKFPEIYQENVFPFRTYSEIQRLIISYEIVYGLGGKKIYINKPNFWNRMLSRICKRDIWVSCRKTLAKIVRDVNTCNPKTVCVNEIDDIDTFTNFFSKKFPTPAPWELE